MGSVSGTEIPYPTSLSYLKRFLGMETIIKFPAFSIVTTEKLAKSLSVFRTLCIAEIV